MGVDTSALIAVALGEARGSRNLSFITLDPPQRDLARKVGFTV